MALLQGLLTLIGKSAGRTLNAFFGWAVRGLFGRTTAREQTFLSVVVAATIAWPVLLVGIAAPKLAALLTALVPIPRAASTWTLRLVAIVFAAVIPCAVGIAVATKTALSKRGGPRVCAVPRGFPLTLGLAGAFIVMLVSVPLMRLSELVRRRKSIDIPLITNESTYRQVAATICEVLNRHGYALYAAPTRWWEAAPMRILTWLGGDAFRASVPSLLEHFVSPDLELSFYPSGLLLRGSAARLTWAHGLIAESVVHTDGLQTVDPRAQVLEKRLRRVWTIYDTAPPQIVGSEDLVGALEQIGIDLGKLQVDFDDWQVLYRQVLQVGRAIHGERQLMDLEAARAQRAKSWPSGPPGLRRAAGAVT